MPALPPALSSPAGRLAALVAGALVVLALVYALRRGDAPAAAGGPAFIAGPALDSAAVGAVQPTAANVDPGVHGRLMALRASVEQDPADTTALLALARFQQDAHQMAEAADAYERVLAAAPAHRQARLDLALAYAELGRWAEARAAMETLLARDADDPAALYNLGAIAANQGDAADARRWWTRAAAQQRDAELARQAAASLDHLNHLAAAGALTPAATAAPAAAPPTPASPAGAPVAAAGASPQVQAVAVRGPAAPPTAASGAPGPLARYHPAIAGRD